MGRRCESGVRYGRADCLTCARTSWTPRYARMRVDYLLADAERQRVLGADRRACHNVLIASCDILARNMAERGEDGTWRK